eukprot:CAMPEP_0197850244 /NCGR_PEP_ID=MMETSP1438-20131217/14748_1 /TAXON_ID=1461541 /ORGANISM="Pterosperma sp., Strain CCMP1384" /LENGTH=247 /DNA_ID=CAMNT_0043463301 /DNA_START=104 /DNA_END=848 /DNA_ORIENTATION=+
MSIREPSHAGSWYTENGNKLSQELEDWLRNAQVSQTGPVRAIIAPHAGYRYSGRCAAYAYKAIDPSTVKRIFLLGPSHHYYLRNCALSKCTHYRTPIGDIPIDTGVYQELHNTGKFCEMNIDVDEAEHSLEMHLPYIAKIMAGYQYTLVPIMVGGLSPDSEALYGRLLSKYMDDPGNIFIISSDFCHWGKRFNFTFYDKRQGPIHKSIEALDHAGMEIIERSDPAAFSQYLVDFENTICGRHPKESY